MRAWSYPLRQWPRKLFNPQHRMAGPIRACSLVRSSHIPLDGQIPLFPFLAARTFSAEGLAFSGIKKLLFFRNPENILLPSEQRDPEMR